MAAAKKTTKPAPAKAAPAAKPRGRPPGSGKKKEVAPGQQSFPQQEMSQTLPNVPVTAPGKPLPWEMPTAASAVAPTPPAVPGVAPVNDPSWLARLTEWYNLKARLEEEFKPLQEQEMEMRRALSQAFFPNPKEGTNTAELPEGWGVLKYTHTLERKYDEAAWAAVFQQLPKGSQEYLIEWKPNLKLTNYRNMDESSKMLLEQCLVTKPGSPKLELVPPKAE